MVVVPLTWAEDVYVDVPDECDICGKSPVVGVFPSQRGPYSFSRCQECSEKPWLDLSDRKQFERDRKAVAKVEGSDSFISFTLQHPDGESRIYSVEWAREWDEWVLKQDGKMLCILGTRNTLDETDEE